MPRKVTHGQSWSSLYIHIEKRVYHFWKTILTMLVFYNFYDVVDGNLTWSATNILDPTYLGKFLVGGCIKKGISGY